MRTQYGRLLAFLSSELGDGDDAEDALQEALLAALTSWPDDGVPAQELPGRLEAVLEAIYAAYGLGRDEAVGADARRGDLVDEAIWLARVVRERMPDEAEVRGLLALLLFCDARRQAGRSPGRRSRCSTIISSDFSDLGRPASRSPRPWPKHPGPRPGLAMLDALDPPAVATCQPAGPSAHTCCARWVGPPRLWQRTIARSASPRRRRPAFPHRTTPPSAHSVEMASPRTP